MNEIKTGTSKAGRKLSFNFNGYALSDLSGESVSLFLCKKEVLYQTFLCWTMNDCLLV